MQTKSPIGFILLHPKDTETWSEVLCVRSLNITFYTDNPTEVYFINRDSPITVNESAAEIDALIDADVQHMLRMSVEYTTKVSKQLFEDN